jgi:hypothetical protein
MRRLRVANISACNDHLCNVADKRAACLMFIMHCLAKCCLPVFQNLVSMACHFLLFEVVGRPCMHMGLHSVTRQASFQRERFGPHHCAVLYGNHPPYTSCFSFFLYRRDRRLSQPAYSGSRALTLYRFRGGDRNHSATHTDKYTPPFSYKCWVCFWPNTK